MKKILSLTLTVIILLCICLPASAAVITPAEPYWDNIDTIRLSLSFDGTAGTIYCKIQGTSETTNISGTLKLYEDGEEIDSWDVTTTSSIKIVSDTFTGKKGSTYTLELDADAKANGVWESIDKSTSAKCS